MRIFFAVSSLSPGGAERMIAELANAFAARGHDIAVVTLSKSDSDHYLLEPMVERIALDVIWDSQSRLHSLHGNIVRSRMIRNVVRQFKPQVVVSFVEQTNVLILAALIGSGFPSIVSERIDPRRHAVGRSWALARRLLYPLASRLVVQTRSVVPWAIRIVPRARVQVIPNFVRPLPRPVLVGRGGAEVLSVGRLARQKGFDVLLKAFARTELAGQGVRLTILGEGPERKSLEALAQELGIASAVQMPGVVKDPETWMGRCTVFVLSSRFEGFPNALIEAMAMGCPVISADCDSGPREIITHEHDGVLVPPEDEKVLAAALERLFEVPDFREQLAGHAVAVRDRFAWDSIVERWEGLIDEVIQENEK